MTTVLFDGRHLYADSMVVYGGIADLNPVKKIKGMSTGRLFVTGAGEWVELTMAFKDPFCSLISEETELLIYEYERKKCTYRTSQGSMEIKGPVAIGTGGDLALAAYLASGDPIKSMKVAIKMDINSGGDILTTNPELYNEPGVSICRVE